MPHAFSKKPPDQHEVMSRSGAYNADTFLDKAPGKEAFSTV